MSLFPEFEPQPVPDRRILVGTSGYSFADWVGPFYPASCRASEFLSYYARHFDAVEVNATYYGIPKPHVLALMERKTPPGFHFIVKLHQSMTHERSLDPARLAEFKACLEPLKEARKYDGLLAQFPWGFHRNATNERFLASLRDAFAGEPMWVEFRNAAWAAPEVPALLREHALGFCAVDEPALEGLMPPVTALTTPDAYVRFHGRNAATWWGSGAAGDRYDYSYRSEELREWMDKVRALAEQARRTYLFFNNCHAGQAARSAKLMSELLRQEHLLD